ncbi:tRNA 2-selenouridine(34) synthase MnmH [Flavobacteriales bacterium]|nr:tRNA 2-selenouridine(34) synthase MnmH [Flavobacteriales bacterium]
MAVPSRSVGVQEFLEGSRKTGVLLLDARSPGEFAEAHIPGALSFPLFDDAERAAVGTLYKQEGREMAVERGLEFIGPRMADMVRQAKALFAEQPSRRPIHMYCWRGGMRSGSLSWLLRTAGLPVVLLEGGYKAYKQTLPEFMGLDWPLVRVGGYTGSAKTAVLHALAEAGEQVVDLEGLARHFGSAFGNLRRHAQPTSEHFRNLLAEALTGLDSSRRIWVENESRRIGNVHVPEPFYKRMIACPALEMLRSMEDRVSHLVGMYGGFETDLLRDAFEAIGTELGGPETREALTALDGNDLATAARIALEYYDRAYEHGLQKRAKDNRHPVDAQGATLAQCAERLMAAADDMGL